jgi:hypothetical protein
MLQMNAPAETQASVETSKVSRLASFIKENEGKKVNETDKKTIVAAFKKKATEREKIVAQLEAIDKAAAKTDEDMVRVFGSKSVTLDGVKYSPTARGERIFYKRMSDTDTVEL